MSPPTPLPHTHTHAHAHAHTHTCTHMHTCTHTCIHTHSFPSMSVTKRSRFNLKRQKRLTRMRVERHYQAKADPRGSKLAMLTNMVRQHFGSRRLMSARSRTVADLRQSPAIIQRFPHSDKAHTRLPYMCSVIHVRNTSRNFSVLAYTTRSICHKVIMQQMFTQCVPSTL